MRKLIIAAALLCIGMMPGCVSAPPESAQQPALTFAHMSPVLLNVAKVEIFDAYKPPMQNPNAEHLMPTPPASAARILAAEKLLADGDSRILRVLIEDASVIRENLPLTEGFWGVLSQEPAERYKARVALRFELVNEEAPDITVGHASVIGTRTKTLVEGVSPAERDRAMTELTEGLMSDLYDGFDTVVRGTFGKI